VCVFWCLFRLYLVVAGGLGIIFNLFSFLKQRQSLGQTSKCWDKFQSAMQALLGVASIGWLIVGSVWVFTLDPGSDFERCDRLLYL